MTSVDQEKLNLVVSMGFHEQSAAEALRRHAGDVNAAVNLLLASSGADITTEASSSGSTSNQISTTQTSMSQYSLPNGRSACTIIALNATSTILSYLHNKQGSEMNLKAFLSDVELQSILLRGCDIYNDTWNTTQEIEHSSVEEVLKKVSSFDVNILNGNIMQGILSHDADSPLGMRSILQQCQRDARNSKQDFICIVLTKSPETVCVILPSQAAPKENAYVLVDSHPRPSLSTNGMYARFHDSLDSLVGDLVTIFPVVDLGNDVGEIMAAMYNSFDVYPLVRK